jgi:DNA-directed RNA polymerase subunit RPC12/RpoP
MALKACRECGKDVSTEAKQCPHCGVSKPIKTRPTIGCGGAILIFFVLGIVMNTFGPKPKPRTAGDIFADSVARMNGDPDSMVRLCKESALENLKSPTSADFASRDAWKVWKDNKNQWNAVGYVDAQNSFGAKIRSSVVCVAKINAKGVYVFSKVLIK